MDNGNEGQEGREAQPALGGPWFVEFIGDRPVIDRSPAHFVFAEDGTVSGSASCNRFNGAYEMSGDALKFGMLATTRRACPGALDEQEQRFLAAVSEVARWAIENGLLFLYDEAGQPLFRAAKHSDAGA